MLLSIDTSRGGDCHVQPSGRLCRPSAPWRRCLAPGSPRWMPANHSFLKRRHTPRRPMPGRRTASPRRNGTLWSTDKDAHKKWSGGVVLQSPVVKQDRATPEEGALPPAYAHHGDSRGHLRRRTPPPQPAARGLARWQELDPQGRPGQPGGDLHDHQRHLRAVGR